MHSFAKLIAPNMYINYLCIHLYGSVEVYSCVFNYSDGLVC